MDKDQKIKKAAKMLQEVIPQKNPYEKTLWEGVLSLIKQSDYGKKNAIVEMESPVPPDRDILEETVDESFDDVQMKILDICQTIFSGHGSLEMVPYSRGMHTRSMTISFKTKGKKGS